MKSGRDPDKATEEAGKKVERVVESIRDPACWERADACQASKTKLTRYDCNCVRSMKLAWRRSQ